MQRLIKPPRLNIGDKVATVSPSWGIAGDGDAVWKYRLGKKRLEKMELKVIPAPNSMKGSEYLSKNPKARADDINWAFGNKDIKAIIANIGGNDSIRLLPFLDLNVIASNPKIFIGYSDVMNIHLFCRRAGLSTFYGHNLLPIIAENPTFHPYSAKWFDKVLFHDEPVGIIEPAETFSCDESDYFDQTARKSYRAENGYIWLQGRGKTRGRLFGGHSDLEELAGTTIEVTAMDFKDGILFTENIPEFFSPKHLAAFADWLGSIGALESLKGILIGKLCGYTQFKDHEKALLQIINGKYGLYNLPIIANMNFGHSSPMCIMPYDALAEIDCDNKRFSILESCVAPSCNR